MYMTVYVYNSHSAQASLVQTFLKRYAPDIISFTPLRMFEVYIKKKDFQTITNQKEHIPKNSKKNHPKQILHISYIHFRWVKISTQRLCKDSHFWSSWSFLPTPQKKALAQQKYILPILSKTSLHVDCIAILPTSPFFLRSFGFAKLDT